MNILDGLNPPQLNFGSSITPNEEQVQKLIAQSTIAIQTNLRDANFQRMKGDG